MTKNRFENATCLFLNNGICQADSQPCDPEEDCFETVADSDIVATRGEVEDLVDTVINGHKVNRSLIVTE